MFLGLFLTAVSVAKKTPEEWVVKKRISAPIQVREARDSSGAGLTGKPTFSTDLIPSPFSIGFSLVEDGTNSLIQNLVALSIEPLGGSAREHVRKNGWYHSLSLCR